MALKHAQSLWPDRTEVPVVRLVVAVVAAPSVISALLSFLVLLVAGMTDSAGQGVVEVTGESALMLSMLVFLFTATFGLAGVAMLWRFGWRNAVAWAFTGGISGALAGVLFSTAAMSGLQQTFVTTFALAGWCVFLLIRRFAGIESDPDGGHSHRSDPAHRSDHAPGAA